MAMLAVVVSIVQDSTILLIKREDFAVWSLPGGEVDPGESFVQAAHREVAEETGLHIRLRHL
jgi:8-oxo-dGTP diphosphatase